MRLIDASPYEDCKIVLNSEDTGFKVREIRTVDAEPIVHAHWIEDDNDIAVRGYCSNCEWQAIMYETDVLGENYCPHCGAKMDEVVK